MVVCDNSSLSALAEMGMLGMLPHESSGRCVSRQQWLPRDATPEPLRL